MSSSTGPAAFGSRTYTFDGASNRISVKVGSSTPVTTTYDAAGLPTSSSDGTTYSHDATGELTGIDRPGGSASDWRFSYSSWSQLTVAEHTPGSADVLYTTDALDRVLSRTSGGATASFTYAGLGETLAKAVVVGTSTLYAWTPGGPLAQKVGTTTRYYARDQHGDTVGWTDTTGTLKGTALYDPWGQVLSSTGEMATPPAQGAFGFQSDLTDAATGQVDMGVRAYEPVLGRFSSPDPLFGDPADPPSLNRFLYGGASPVTYSDPTGLMPVCGEGCTRQEEAEIIKDYATSYTQAGASEYSPAVSTSSGASAMSPPEPPRLVSLISAVSAVITRLYYFVNPWLEAGSAGVDALEGVEAEASGAFARAAAIIGRESAVVDSERGWAFRTSPLGRLAERLPRHSGLVVGLVALTADLYVGAERGETLPRTAARSAFDWGGAYAGGQAALRSVCSRVPNAWACGGSIFLGALAGGLFGEKFFQALLPDPKSVSLLRQDLRRSLDPISQFGCYLGVNDPFC